MLNIYFVLLLVISVYPQPASTMLIAIWRYHTQGVKEVPSSLAHWRKKIGVETTCVEIKFQAPITYWLIPTQVPTWKSIVCLIHASFETPHLA